MKKLTWLLFPVGILNFILMPIIFPLHASLYIIAGISCLFVGVYLIDRVSDKEYSIPPKLDNGEP